MSLYLQVLDGLFCDELLFFVPFHSAHYTRPDDANYSLLWYVVFLHFFLDIWYDLGNQICTLVLSRYFSGYKQDFNQIYVWIQIKQGLEHHYTQVQINLNIASPLICHLKVWKWDRGIWQCFDLTLVHHTNIEMAGLSLFFIQI